MNMAQVADSRRRGLARVALVWLLGCLTAGGGLLAVAPHSGQPAARRYRTKSIEDVRVGDWVLAKNPNEGGMPTPHQVLAVPRNWTEHVVHVGITGGGELQATRGHPFFTANRGWLDAKDLRSGDLLQDFEGRPVYVSTVQIEDRTCGTFNLTVDGLHTFYALAGGVPVLVHNVNTYPDPGQPGYSNGSSNLDHILARSLGGSDDRSNLQSLPSETNFRKGGHEGQLVRDRSYYRSHGMSAGDADQVVRPEAESLGKSPPPRPMDPDDLDKLPCR